MRIVVFAHWLVLTSTLHAAQPDWVLEARVSWKARDSQIEWVFGDRMWIGGGWFDSKSTPPRDIWSTADGKNWTQVEGIVPWESIDLPMSLIFADRMWLMGGRHNQRSSARSSSSEVWSSTDGKEWKIEAEKSPWSARSAGAVVEHRGRMWLLGGIENYNLAGERSLMNDVWSSTDGKAWKQHTAAALWTPRAYHQAVALHDRIYVLGGGNYGPNQFAKNDVWSSPDGVTWIRETESAPWPARISFAAAVYRNRIWVLGGWSKEKGELGDVWHSADGRSWERLETKVCWASRHEHSGLVFQDKLWVIGGHVQPHSNEAWSLHLPADWKP